jgi:hypothetical protein
MSEPCEFCGTPVDDSDYQDDGYRHTDGRCTEYLKAALAAANKHAAGMASLATHLQAELDQVRRRADDAEHKLTQIRAILENYENDEHFSAWNAIGEIEELKP